jgi:hypothetical protein
VRSSGERIGVEGEFVLRRLLRHPATLPEDEGAARRLGDPGVEQKKYVRRPGEVPAHQRDIFHGHREILARIAAVETDHRALPAAQLRFKRLPVGGGQHVRRSGDVLALDRLDVLHAHDGESAFAPHPSEQETADLDAATRCLQSRLDL